MPVELWWNLLSCDQTPLPAVPDEPMLLSCEFELRISIPYRLQWPSGPAPG